MKKSSLRKTLRLILAVLLLMITGCGQMEERLENKSVSRSREVIISEIIAQMTPAQKIGQLLMIGIHGTEVNDDSRFLLSQYHFGGVILFDRNLETAEQVKSLTEGLQKAGSGSLPLFIAIDEEGGQVARMRQVVEPPPAQRSLGATGKPELVEEWAAKTGGRLRELGFNVNFAPVADLGSLGTRHFSEEPEQVSRFVQAAAKGYMKAGIAHSLKHFPGLGKGKEDTHYQRTVINITREELTKEDLRPFREAIKANKSRQDSFMVMLTHAVYPQLTGEIPSGFSPEVCRLLRQELDFNGIIITDDMEMAGADVAPFRQLGVLALQAGADIVLVCHEYDHEREVYLGLLEALEKGVISQQRVDESLRRIIAAKLWLREQ